MTLTDYAKSYARTVVPYVVGLIVAFAARHGLKLDAQETAALSFGVGTAYYAVVRLLERYVTPRFGWLLGLAQQPVYAKVTTRKDVPVLKTPHLTTGHLPKPSGRKLGHLPSPRDDRDYLYRPTARAKALQTVHNAAGLVFDALGNLQVGDCAEAGEEHGRQVMAHLAGRAYTPTTAETIGLYSAITGYRPGDASTDNGTVLRQMLDYLLKHGVITRYARVATDAVSLHQAIIDHGFVLAGFALPTGAESEGVKWRVPRSGKTAGSWGGHCVPLVGASRDSFDIVSWGELGTASKGFVADYLDEAWVITYADSALG